MTSSLTHIKNKNVTRESLVTQLTTWLLIISLSHFTSTPMLNCQNAKYRNRTTHTCLVTNIGVPLGFTYSLPFDHTPNCFPTFNVTLCHIFINENYFLGLIDNQSCFWLTYLVCLVLHGMPFLTQPPAFIPTWRQQLKNPGLWPLVGVIIHWVL